MVVNIIDANDNPPFFELAEYHTAPIRETVQPGTVVLTGEYDDFLKAEMVSQHF